MPGVKRCGIKVNPDGTLNEEGKPCALKAGHDLATVPHKPRVPVVVSDDDLAAISGSVAVVTESAALSEARRTRSMDDSPLSKMAVKVTQGAYDAWVRGGKKLKWEDTPAIALNVPSGLEDKLRSAIHAACAVAKRRAQFGDSKPVGDDGKMVKIFFQVRDIPAKKDTPPADTTPAVTPSPAAPTPAQAAAAAAAASRKVRV